MRQLLFALGFLAVGFGWGGVALAAELKIVSEGAVWRTGDEVLVQFTIDTEQPANAISGKLLFPAELLTVRDIQDGNTVVNFWIEQPAVAGEGVIGFAGMTPGGILGTNEVLFSVLFHATKEGAGEIAASDIELLLNDGQATPLSVTKLPLAFSVSDTAQTPTSSLVEDNEPPEDFVLEFAQDANIFAGRTFIVFATQDKGSGIDHYEVKEGLWGKYQVSESPYVLKHPEEKRLSVKAIDNAGNERIVTMGDEDDLLAYRRRALLGALIVMTSVGLIFVAGWAIVKRLRA